MVTGHPPPNVQSSQGVLQGLNTKPGSRLQESSLKSQSPQSSSVNNWCVCFYIPRKRTQQEAGPLLTASRSTYVQMQKAPGSKGVCSGTTCSTWFSRDLSLPSGLDMGKAWTLLQPLAQWAGSKLPTGPSPVVGTTVLRNSSLPVFAG